MKKLSLALLVFGFIALMQGNDAVASILKGPHAPAGQVTLGTSRYKGAK